MRFHSNRIKINGILTPFWRIPELIIGNRPLQRGSAPLQANSYASMNNQFMCKRNILIWYIRKCWLLINHWNNWLCIHGHISQCTLILCYLSEFYTIFCSPCSSNAIMKIIMPINLYICIYIYIYVSFFIYAAPARPMIKNWHVGIYVYIN